LEDLEELYIDNCLRLEYVDIDFSKWKRLKIINISGNSNLTDNTLDALGKSGSLEKIIMVDCRGINQVALDSFQKNCESKGRKIIVVD